MKNRAFDLLPSVNRTETLDKFFNATVDRLFSTPDIKKTTGYIGRRFGEYYKHGTDYYHTEPTITRSNYQLEPALTVKDVDSGDYIDSMQYDELIERLRTLGANVDNHERLFSSPYYSWAPPIDIDKLVNYQNYYWYPEGVSTPVNVLGYGSTVEEAIDVEAEIIGATSYKSPNGVTFSSGMHIIFSNNIYPIEYVGRVFIVENVGRSIQLIDAAEIDKTVTYVEFRDIPWDASLLPEGSSDIAQGWDAQGWDGEPTQDLSQVDYMTIQRGSQNKNAWSRVNSWYHRDVLEAAIDTTRYQDRYSLYRTHITKWDASEQVPGTEDNLKGWDVEAWDGITMAETLPVFSLDHLRQAKRPIIEFFNDIELQDAGYEFLTNVSLVSTNPYELVTDIDGEPVATTTLDFGALRTGQKIVFVGATDNNIYDVTEVSGNIILVVALTAKTRQSIMVKNGKESTGREFWWNGTGWTESQPKSQTNQAPLFVYSDYESVAFDDAGIYPDSTFAGGKIFSYAEGTGMIDSVLSIPLKYKELGQTSDIVFDNHLQTDNFESSLDILPLAYYRKIKIDGLSSDPALPSERATWTIGNDWHRSDVETRQPIAEKFIVVKETDKTYRLDAIPRVSDDGYAEIEVYVNGNILMQGVGPALSEYYVQNDQIIFTDNYDIFVDDYIEVFASTDGILPENSLAYFTIPKSLEYNAANATLDEMTIAELLEHFRSIMDNQFEFNGYSYGENNYRDTPRDLSKGTKFLQYNYSMLPLMYLMLETNEGSLVEAIDFNKQRYSAFKKRLMRSIESLDISAMDNAEIQLDEILGNLHSVIGVHNVFSLSNLLAYGPNSVSTGYTIQSDLTAELNGLYWNQVTDRSEATYVYYNNIQLLHKVEFEIVETINSLGQTVNKLTFFTDSPVSDGDTITVVRYKNVGGSFIPATPASLGLGRLHAPEIITDDTFVEPVMMIIGHDGSKTAGFSDADSATNTIRNNILIEFEKRIYSSSPAKFVDLETERYDVSEVIGGKYRTTRYSKSEIEAIARPLFLQWSIGNQINIGEHGTYDESLWKTWNYSGILSMDGDVLAGHWKGIYNWYYDTTRPHTNPWEMLGFTRKPLWWESEYGTDYSDTNTTLWDDLEAGKIRQGSRDNVTDGSFATNNPWARSGLSNVIPVDNGNILKSPLGTGIISSAPSSELSKKSEWVFGDRGPAEEAFWTSAEGAFVLEQIKFLTKPAKYSSFGFDTIDMITRNNQIISSEKGRRKTPSEITIQTTSLIHGFQSWLFSAYAQDGITPTPSLDYGLANLDVNLSYRFAGFIDQNDFRVSAMAYSADSTSSSVLVPKENINIFLNIGPASDVKSCSGVIIEKTSSGYRVFGYDDRIPEFLVKTQIVGGTPKILKFGDDTVTYAENYDGTNEVVPYNTTFKTREDVISFIIAYGKQLEEAGWIYDKFDIDAGEILNWKYSAKQFAFWSTQSEWEDGSFITISPFATGAKLSTNNKNVRSLATRVNGMRSVVDASGRSISTKDLIIDRGQDQFEIYEKDNRGIFGIRVAFDETEHAIIFDNITLFNDTMYDPILGHRQDRLKISVAKTRHWSGKVDPGGVLVTTSGMIPNFEKSVSDVRDYYSTRNDILDPLITAAANATFGYEVRDYLREIIDNDDDAHSFVRGMSREKGTAGVLDKLLRAKTLYESTAVTLNEEFAIKLGEFGNIALKTGLEVIPTSVEPVSKNPIIEMVNGIATGATSDQKIRINSQSDDRWTVKPNVPIDEMVPRFRLGYVPSTWLPSAGYANLDTVIYKAFDSATLVDNTANAVIGETAWIASLPDTNWGVFKLTDTGLTVTGTFVSQPGTEITKVVTNVPHSLFDGQVVNLPSILDAEETKVDVSGPRVALVSSIRNARELTLTTDFTTDTIDLIEPNLSTLADVVIVDGGTDYGIGDELDLIGGSGTTATLRVDEVYDGVITQVTITDVGSYIVQPNTNNVNTASITYHLISALRANDGTGYAIGDTLTVVGGTGVAAILTIVTIGGAGEIVEVEIEYEGSYTVLPANPNTVTTDGSGTGATMDLDYATGTNAIFDVTYDRKVDDSGNVLVTPEVSHVLIEILEEITDTGSYTTNGLTLRESDTTDLLDTSSTVINTVSTAAGTRIVVPVLSGQVGLQLYLPDYATITAGKIRITSITKDIGAFDIAVFTDTAGETNTTDTINAWISRRYATAEELYADEANLVDGDIVYVDAQSIDGNSIGKIKTVTIVSGGIDYTVGDTLTIVGGHFKTPATLTVVTAPSGEIGSVSLKSEGFYTTPPTGTVTVTGGTGSGATFTAEMVGGWCTFEVNTLSGGMADEYTYTTGPEKVSYNTIYDFDTGSLIKTVVDVTSDIDGVITYTDARIGTLKTYKLMVSEDRKVNYKMYEGARLYNRTHRRNDGDLTYIDPAKGIISGFADNEIHYKLQTDPARYTDAADASMLSENDSLWGKDQIGLLWWDISTIKYPEYEQGTNEYRRTYWGKPFVGSSIDIYEWVESSVMPSEYTDPGIVYDDVTYVDISTYDDRINSYITKYYFWVKGRDTVPATESRRVNAVTVAKNIKNPTLQGLKWYAPISNRYSYNVVINGTNSVTIPFEGSDEIIAAKVNNIPVPFTTVGESIGFDSVIATSDEIVLTRSDIGGAFNVVNTDDILSVGEVALQIDFQTVLSGHAAHDTHHGNKHVEWMLLSDGDDNSYIPDILYMKLIDSLSGIDGSGSQVPDTVNLSSVQTIGNSYRPRRTWFENLYKARREAHTWLNDKLSTIDVDITHSGWDRGLNLKYIERVDIELEKIDDITHVVDDFTAFNILDSLGGIHENDVIEITDSGSGRATVVKIKDGLPVTVILRDSAININASLLDISTTEDAQIFRDTLVTLTEKIFVHSNAILRNTFYFAMVNYVLAEQEETDWVFKTTYLRYKIDQRNIGESKFFQKSIIPHLSDFFDDVRPFRSKLRDFTEVKGIRIEEPITYCTDFDNPPFIIDGDVTALQFTNQDHERIMFDNNEYAGFMSEVIIADQSNIRSFNTSIAIDRITKEFDITSILASSVIGDGDATARLIKYDIEANRLATAIDDFSFTSEFTASSIVISALANAGSISSTSVFNYVEIIIAIASFDDSFRIIAEASSVDIQSYYSLLEGKNEYDNLVTHLTSYVNDALNFRFKGQIFDADIFNQLDINARDTNALSWDGMIWDANRIAHINPTFTWDEDIVIDRIFAAFDYDAPDGKMISIMSEYYVETTELGAAKVLGAGINYLIGDLVTITGGIGDTPATLEITRVSVQGAVEDFRVTDGGKYLTKILKQHAVTGGSGTGFAVEVHLGVIYQNILYADAAADVTFIPDPLDIDRTGIILNLDEQGFIRTDVEDHPEELIPLDPREMMVITTVTTDDTDPTVTTRSLYDEYGNVRHSVLPDATKTALTTPINSTDTIIQVDDVSVLEYPSYSGILARTSGPSFVWIGTELIEYSDIDMDNNKLLHCRRGQSTTTSASHVIGTIVHDAAAIFNIPNSIDTIWFNSGSALHDSTTPAATFILANPGTGLA